MLVDRLDSWKLNEDVQEIYEELLNAASWMQIISADTFPLHKGGCKAYHEYILFRF